MIDEEKLLGELIRLGQSTERQLEGAENNDEETFCFSLKNQLAMLKNVIRRIRKQPKIGVWIPCSERLPEEPFGCLVTVIDANPLTMEEFENILPYHVGYDGGQWNDSDGERIPFDVIAWQPLPEPYNGEERKEA